MMVITILLSLIANLITVFLGVLAGLVVLTFRRTRILKFYGIRQRHDEIRIIVPRLDVQAGGAIAAIEVSKGYAGPAVTQLEYEAATLLQEQIRLNASSWLSREVRDWVAGKSLVTAAVNPIIELAPAPAGAPSWLQSRSRTNLILLGGPAYNATAGYYQKHESAHFAFRRGGPRLGWHVRLLRGRASQDEGIIEGRTVGQELAIIQRIILKDTGVSITMCSGSGAGATFAGAEWLSRSYRQLDRRYRDEEYGILLAFPGVTNPQSRFPEGTSMMVRDGPLRGGKRDCFEIRAKKKKKQFRQLFVRI